MTNNSHVVELLIFEQLLYRYPNASGKKVKEYEMHTSILILLHTGNVFSVQICIRKKTGKYTLDKPYMYLLKYTNVSHD